MSAIKHTEDDLDILIRAALNERHGQPERGVALRTRQNAAAKRLMQGELLMACPGGYCLTTAGRSVIQDFLTDVARVVRGPGGCESWLI